MTFEEANQKVHPVTDQWHYPIMKKYGFEPLTEEAIGFVRTYKYKNSSGRMITCTTGANADYWQDETKSIGFHSELEPHLQKISK